MGPAFKVTGSDEENLVLVGRRGADRRPQFGKFGENPRTVTELGGRYPARVSAEPPIIFKGSVSFHEVKVARLGHLTAKCSANRAWHGENR